MSTVQYSNLNKKLFFLKWNQMSNRVFLQRNNNFQLVSWHEKKKLNELCISSGRQCLLRKENPKWRNQKKQNNLLEGNRSEKETLETRIVLSFAKPFYLSRFWQDFLISFLRPIFISFRKQSINFFSEKALVSSTCHFSILLIPNWDILSRVSHTKQNSELRYTRPSFHIHMCTTFKWMWRMKTTN
jgi:hypothetical protein